MVNGKENSVESVTVWPGPAAGLEGEGSTLDNEAFYFYECWWLGRTAAGRTHSSIPTASIAPISSVTWVSDARVQAKKAAQPGSCSQG